MTGGAEHLETIPTRAHRFRLFCLLPAQWVRASLELAERRVDFHASPVRPRLSRPAILWEAARGLLAHADHAATRRVLDGRAPVIE